MTPVFIATGYHEDPRRRAFHIMRAALPKLRGGFALSDFLARLVWVAAGPEPEECNGAEFFARHFLRAYLCLSVARDGDGSLFMRPRHRTPDSALSWQPGEVAAQRREAATRARAELPQLYDRQTIIDAVAYIAGAACGPEPAHCSGPVHYARHFLDRFLHVRISRDEWGTLRAFVATS